MPGRAQWRAAFVRAVASQLALAMLLASAIVAGPLWRAGPAMDGLDACPATSGVVERVRAPSPRCTAGDDAGDVAPPPRYELDHEPRGPSLTAPSSAEPFATRRVHAAGPRGPP